MNKKDCITFDARSARRHVSIKPMVHVANTGLCKFNQLAVDLMKLKDGDAVIFHQGKRDKAEWAIELADASVGFILRKEKGRDDRLLCNAAIAAKTLLASLHLARGQWIPVGLQPEEGLFDLITSAVKA